MRLIILHLAFYLPLSRAFRRSTTMLVANMGKWALTVVVVFCAGLVDLFNLQGRNSFVELWQAVDGKLHDKCEAFCANSTLAPEFNCTRVCDELDPIIDILPTELQGDVTYGLEATPLDSLFWFCVGTLFAWFCDILVMELEKRAPGARHGLSRGELVPPSLHDPPSSPGGLEEDSWIMLPKRGRQYELSQRGAQARAPRLARRPRSVVCALLGLQLVLTVVAIATTFYTRSIDGSLIHLLQRSSFSKSMLQGKLHSDYSLWDIGWVQITSSSGSSLFMGVTFIIYLIVCPLLRPLTLLLVASARLPLRATQILFELSRYVSYSCGLDVALAMPWLLRLAFGTAGLSKLVGSHEVCTALPDAGESDGECLIYAVDPAYGYWLTAVAFLLSLVLTFEPFGLAQSEHATRTLRPAAAGFARPAHVAAHSRSDALHAALYPKDAPPTPVGCWRRRRQRRRQRRRDNASGLLKLHGEASE